MQQKVLFFTVTNDLVYDQRMIRICTSLAQNDYSVHLIGRLKKSSKSLDDKNYNQKRIKCFFEKGKFFYLEYNIRLFFFLLFSKFDAVCAIDLDTLVAGYAASRLKRKTCIYDAHEFFTEVPEVIDRPFVKGIWEAVGNFIIPKLKHCYTVCESLADVFLEKYQTRFEVIRNVPFKKPENKVFIPKNATKIILYQGALNEGRGLEQAIFAMKHIPDAVLWLVGEGDLSKQLRELSAAHNLGGKVIFKGYLKPEKLTELTSQATIGLNLLENKSLNYFYSLANKAFDYIQAELPAIHMNFPEYQHLNNSCEVACLVDDLEPLKLAEVIRNLLEDSDLYEKLAQNCRMAKTIFIWEKEEQKLLDFYKNVFIEE